MSENKETLVFDVRKADASYKPFPTFAEWRKNTHLKLTRWDRYTNRLNQLKQTANGDIVRVREAIEVATAIDTGALEGLYETDRGFTYTVAFESAVWQTVVEEKKGEKVRALIEAQLNAFEYVLDFATKSVPITSAWIRELHKEICREQDTYKAYTELGLQDLPLPKGEYKILPNHVRKQDGTIHSHAPVDLTVNEMIRLCDELNTDEFQNAHPVLQASYAHYAFVLVHPFADGNGRVSRALASIYTYRSHSIPLLIFSDSRGNYLSALEDADLGNYQSFVDFILEIGLSSIQLFSESIESSLDQSVQDLVGKIENLYITKGGYSQQEVDTAGITLLEHLKSEFNQLTQSSNLQHISFQISGTQGGTSHLISDKYRDLISGRRSVKVNFMTEPPATASITKDFVIQVPKDCGQSDDFIIMEQTTSLNFEARASELIPKLTATLQMRLKLFTKRIFQQTLDELFRYAKKTIQN